MDIEKIHHHCLRDSTSDREVISYHYLELLLYPEFLFVPKRLLVSR